MAPYAHIAATGDFALITFFPSTEPILAKAGWSGSCPVQELILLL